MLLVVAFTVALMDTQRFELYRDRVEITGWLSGRRAIRLMDLASVRATGNGVTFELRNGDVIDGPRGLGAVAGVGRGDTGQTYGGRIATRIMAEAHPARTGVTEPPGSGDAF